jgi:hypothetical protein
VVNTAENRLKAITAAAEVLDDFARQDFIEIWSTNENKQTAAYVWDKLYGPLPPRTVEELTDLLNQVLHDAVSSQYIGSGKYRAHLYDIMRRIDPKVADVFDHDPEKAYAITARRIGMDTDAG